MNGSTGENAIELLKADHRKVEQLVEAFEKAGSDGKRAQIAEQICTELTVHAQIEEQVFYPALREQFAEKGIELLDEALIEHAVVKGMINEIRNSTAGEALYEAKVKVLGELVKHHVKEEEREIMPTAQKCDIDMNELGAQLAQAKADLLAQME